MTSSTIGVVGKTERIGKKDFRKFDKNYYSKFRIPKYEGPVP
jgi:hypothetical protein